MHVDGIFYLSAIQFTFIKYTVKSDSSQTMPNNFEQVPNATLNHQTQTNTYTDIQGTHSKHITSKNEL